MNTLQDELSRELTRIIACTYPASLMTLADILSHANEQIVRTCVLQLSPCAIVRLASIVMAALPLWPYSLEILHVLCHSPEFRQALLKGNPALLDTVLTKASGSQSEFAEYNDICVQLLSHQLPEAVPLPESTQTFFLRLFYNAVKSPTVDTLKPVYLCLKGACKGLLRFLSLEAQKSIDQELRQILKSSSTLQNSTLLLWCFGIVILSESPQDGRQQQWKTVSGQKLFGTPENQGRTINLACLSVIFALKGEGEGEMSVADAMEGIRIATQTIQCIESSVRHGWPASKPVHRSTVAKLMSRAVQTGIAPSAQLEALTFYATLVGEHNLQAEVITRYEALLLRMLGFCTSAKSLQEMLQLSLPVFAPHIRESTIRQLLSDILTITMVSTETNKMGNALALLEVLVEAIPNCASFCSQASLALSSQELQGTVESFLKCIRANVKPRRGDSEERSVRSLRRKLYAAANSMFLTTAVAKQSSDNGLPQSVILQLIKTQQGLLQDQQSCSHFARNPSAHVSLFEQPCTQSTGVFQEDWRDRLRFEMTRQTSYQQETVIRSVAQICQDLEDRCNNVEGPLRRERDKSKELIEKVARLEEELAHLREECEDQKAFTSGCETERDDALDRIKVLEKKLQQSESDLKESNENADETLHRAKDEYRTAESKLRSAISAREETIVSLQEKIKALEEQIQTKDEKLHEESRQKETLQSKCEDLNSQAETLRNDLDRELKNLADQTEEAQRLRAAVKCLEDRFGDATKEIEAVSEQRAALERQHQELLRSSDQALKGLETSYISRMEVAAAKSKEEHDNLQAELEGAIADRQHAQKVYEDARRDVQVAQDTARSLEKKIQQLVEEAIEKDEEIEELQLWKSRIMGVAAEGPAPARRHARPRTSTQNSARPHLPRKSQVVVRSPAHAPASAQEITNTAMEVVANASFSSSEASSREGSTPKRPRPRPSFKITDMHTPYSKKTELIHKSTSRNSHQAKRPALQMVSPHRRHTTVGFTVVENEHADGEDANEKRRGSLKYAGQPQNSFDSEGYLASTPFTPGGFECSTQKPPEGEETGEQTTEL